MRINNSSKHNIWTGVEYRRCLLFKRFLCCRVSLTRSRTRNKGTKVKWGNRKWGEELCVKDRGEMGTDINEAGIQGQRVKQEEQGQQGVSEIDGNRNGEATVWGRLCQRSISDLISNTSFLICLSPFLSQWVISSLAPTPSAVYTLTPTPIRSPVSTSHVRSSPCITYHAYLHD